LEDNVRNSILIVDDEALNHKYLTHILGKDYDLYSAKDGFNGLKTAREALPDVILLDIIMPVMNGYEVLTALKSAPETRDIPVIFITGLNSSEDEEKGLTFDAADYISKPFSSEIVKLRIRNQIKIVNQIRTINSLSSTDKLTGIPNRRGFDNHISREVGRTTREGLPLSVLLIDVDNFKMYNDMYGHQQGDVALQTVASTLSGSLQRSTDYVARWGGEEFIVVLSNTDMEGAMLVAERLRECIEQTPIPLVKGEVTYITISVGVNTSLPKRKFKLEEFIAGADKALYEAKRNGRNKVCY